MPLQLSKGLDAAYRQGCYGSEDITVLTPYTGQLLLLRKALEKHTLVFLDEADQKIVDDMDTAGSAGSHNQEDASKAAQEAATNVCHDTVRRRVRLATVDNFQGWLLRISQVDSGTINNILSFHIPVFQALQSSAMPLARFLILFKVAVSASLLHLPAHTFIHMFNLTSAWPDMV